MNAAHLVLLVVSVTLFAVAAWFSIPAALFAWASGFLWAGTKALADLGYGGRDGSRG